MEQSRVASHEPRNESGSLVDRKYMTFQLADEVYGLDILVVREIVGFMRPTPMPRAPAAVSGVINLRGQVIPVMDLRTRLGLAHRTATDQTVIIVVQCRVATRALTMGLTVDLVLDVKTFAADQIEPPSNLGGRTAAALLQGIGKSEKEIVLLLDVSNVLAGDGCRAVPASLPPSA